MPKPDFITSAGHVTGGDSRSWSGPRGKRPTAIIADLGVLTPDPETKETTLTALHRGAPLEQAAAAAGWPIKVTSRIETNEPPSRLELEYLGELHARTHGQQADG